MALLLILQRMLRESGSIEAFFLEGDDPSQPHVGAALDSFSTRALATDLREAYGRRVPKQRGVTYFFPRPSAGSACKRLNLFLRWMVRRDEIDLGVWTRLSPARLIVPLDTHVIRLGRCLRLTRYTSPGWKMASEITASLRNVDAARPGPLRLCPVPCRDDERLWIRQAAAGLPVPVEGPLLPQAETEKIVGPVLLDGPTLALSNSGFPERLSGVRRSFHLTFGGSHEVSVPDLRRREEVGDDVQGRGGRLHGRVFRVHRGHQDERTLPGRQRASACADCHDRAVAEREAVHHRRARSPRRRSSWAATT